MNIGFIWYNAWYPNIQITTTCIQYEKASVLFNIAAVYSQMAAQERLSSLEGKQRAAKNFQAAASVLIHIRDVYCQRLKVSAAKNSEFNENNLSVLSTLMLAQAAECFYQKANDGTILLS
jgi:programmed cell death 6-interacting protein